MLYPRRLKYQSNPGRKRNFKQQKLYIKYQNFPPLAKGYLDFCFSFSLKQLISIPTRVANKTPTLIDYVLTDSSQKVSQCSIIELGISDQDLVYCTKKKPSFKLNKHNDISIRSMKNYTKAKNFRATK